MLDSEFETSNVVVFGFIIGGDLALVNTLQSRADELAQLVTTAGEFRAQKRSAFEAERKKLIDAADVEASKWAVDTAKQRTELTELNEGLKLVKDQEFKQRFGVDTTPRQELNISVPFLIQTNITRFGPMIIILFFVSILVNLYRYNIRLSAYYDARADALELIDLKIKPDVYEKYVSSLSPDMLDIGKPPKLPTEHAVDLAKAALAKAASGK